MVSMIGRFPRRAAVRRLSITLCMDRRYLFTLGTMVRPRASLAWTSSNWDGRQV